MDLFSITIITVIIIIALIYIYFIIKEDGLRAAAINLIVKAESAYAYGKNTEKFNYVFDMLYEKVPVFLKFFLTKENIKDFIQKIFDEVKIALDYKK